MKRQAALVELGVPKNGRPFGNLRELSKGFRPHGGARPAKATPWRCRPDKWEDFLCAGSFRHAAGGAPAVEMSMLFSLICRAKFRDSHRKAWTDLDALQYLVI